MDRALAPGRRFRPEIEGLRAVAAVLVALYHVFTNRVSGGVDVFFVIAGFLVTTTLLAHVEGTGRIEAGRYLARLGARLLPLALLVLAVVSVATLLWMPATREADTFAEIAASALYVENWALALKAVDYAARDAAQSPVQQFWAVSVQGQFYLLWLVLFAGLLRVAGAARFRRWLGPTLALVFVASLALSITLTAANQPLAYFHTLARAWEFAAGGLLVLASSAIAAGITRAGPWGARIAALGGWLGLAIILATGVTIRVAAQFPGWVALIPVAGAVLVLVGAGTGLRWGSDRLLGSRPFVFVGGVAYGLYLWHWSILVFYRIVRRGAIGPVAGIGILALSFLLAVVTTRLLEHPVRARLSADPRAWRVVRTGVAAAVGLAIVASGLAFATQPPSPPASLEAADFPGAAAMADGFVPTGRDVPYQPRPESASKDLTAAHADDNACMTALNDPDPILCTFGDPDGEVTAMLVGASHATHWLPALEPIARDRGWKLVTAVKPGCSLTSGPFEDTDKGRSCRDWNRAVLDLVLADPPDVLITMATLTSPTDESVPDGYREPWAELDAAGIPIVGLRDTPRSPVHVPACLTRHGGDPARCVIDRTLAPRSDASALAGLPATMHVVDLTEWLCDETTCPVVIGNVLAYRDRDHFTASFARTLAPMLAEQVPDADALDSTEP